MKADRARNRTKRQNSQSKTEKRLNKIKKLRLNQEVEENSDNPSSEDDMFKTVTKEEFEKEDIERKNFVVGGKFSDSDDECIKKAAFVKSILALPQKKSLAFFESGQKRKVFYLLVFYVLHNKNGKFG